MWCPECGADMYETTEPVIRELHGVTTVVTGVPHWQCERCDNYALDGEYATMFARKQIEQVSRAKGVKTPAEIRGLRKRLGMTQAEFENMLGVSTPTCSRWENGAAFPAKSTDRLMRAMMELPELASIYSDELSHAIAEMGERVHAAWGSGEGVAA